MRTGLRASWLLVLGLGVASSCGGLGTARPSQETGGQSGAVSRVGGQGGGITLTITTGGAGGTLPSTTATTAIGTGGTIGQTDFIGEEPIGSYTANIYPGDVPYMPLAIDGGGSVTAPKLARSCMTALPSRSIGTRHSAGASPLDSHSLRSP
jgi:hypothetical protein